MSFKDDGLTGGVTGSYQEFILSCLSRLNYLASTAETSYDRNTHEACLNDLWRSIPKAKKSEWKEGWEELEKKYDVWAKGLSPEDKRRQSIERVEQKKQIVIEILYDMGQLFEEGDSFLQKLHAKGRLEKNE